jgi:hypothetical protein
MRLPFRRRIETCSRHGATRLELILALVIVGVVLVALALVFKGGRNGSTDAAVAVGSNGARGDVSRFGDITPDSSSQAEAPESFADDMGPGSGTGFAGDVEMDVSASSNPLLLAQTKEVRQSVVDKFSAALTDGRPDWGAFDRIITTVGSDEFVAALQFIMELPWSQERDRAMKSLMRHMASINPVAALELAEALPSARQRQAAIDAVTEAWAAGDPEAALAMLLAGKTPEGTAVRLNPGLLFAAMYRRDSAWALGSLAALGDDRTREQAVRGIFVDPEDAEGTRRALVGFFGTAEDPRVARTAAQVLAQEWGRVAPSDAAAWVATIDDGSVRSSATRELAHIWSRVAPGEAIEWLAGMNDTSLAASSAGQVVSHWQRDNPAGIGLWLHETNPSAVRDAVAASYVDITLGQAPVVAFETAATIADPDTRVKMMSKAAASWARRDLPAATVAVLESDLPDSIKRRYASKAIKPR